MKSKASATWFGPLKDGKGRLTTNSGVLSNTPYSYSTRFEGRPGTNPEELVGAAHAGCFAMALSMLLGEAGITPRKIQAEATVTLEQKEGSFTVTSSHLDVSLTVPGADEAVVLEAAQNAKAQCPISKLLNAAVTMEVRLLQFAPAA